MTLCQRPTGAAGGGAWRPPAGPHRGHLAERADSTLTSAGVVNRWWQPTPSPPAGVLPAIRCGMSLCTCLHVLVAWEGVGGEPRHRASVGCQPCGVALFVEAHHRLSRQIKHTHLGGEINRRASTSGQRLARATISLGAPRSRGRTARTHDGTVWVSATWKPALGARVAGCVAWGGRSANASPPCLSATTCGGVTSRKTALQASVKMGRRKYASLRAFV